MPVVPPIDLSEVILLETLNLNLGPLALRLLGIALLVLNSFLFSKLFKKSLWAFLVFLFNPGSVFLHTFFTIQCLSLSFALVLIKKQKTLLFLFLSLAVFLFFQKTLPRDYLFLSKMKPSSLATEINERQKMDFLATNKTYILPQVVRKATYNKPTLALDKLVRHFVSFFDFEQMSSPLESYEIIKLSGLSPKGNFPLLFLWEIPLIIYGVFLSKKHRFSFLLSLIPIFSAEKKLFVQTAFLAMPFLLFWEVTALKKLLNLLKPRLFLGLALAVFLIGIFPYYQTFYAKPFVYKSSESYFYQQIASWLATNQDQQVVVTTIFGPTEKMVVYYLGSLPPGVSFENFALSEDAPKENTYYLGLPGQFVSRGRNLQEKTEKSKVTIVDQIEGEGELVFEYGENLWIGYQK